jgi:hypothetical protein
MNKTTEVDWKQAAKDAEKRDGMATPGGKFEGKQDAPRSPKDQGIQVPKVVKGT